MPRRRFPHVCALLSHVTDTVFARDPFSFMLLSAWMVSRTFSSYSRFLFLSRLSVEEQASAKRQPPIPLCRSLQSKRTEPRIRPDMFAEFCNIVSQLEACGCALVVVNEF